MKTSATNTSSGEALVYRGPMVYRQQANGTLTLYGVSFGEGRITPAGVRYHVCDHLGSVKAVVNGPNGDIYTALDYDEYGTVSTSSAVTTVSAPAGETFRTRFTGHEDQGPDFGLPYTDFGARHYSSSLRRWLTPDPMSEKYYDISPYAYCANNPVNLVDPDGKELFICNYKYYDGKLFNESGEEVSLRNVSRFVRKAFNAIQTITEAETGSKLINRLIDSDNSFFITKSNRSGFSADNVRGANAIAINEQNAEAFGSIDIGSGGTISWNPFGTIIPTTDGGRINPVIDLAHELFHAADADKGLLDNRIVMGLKKNEWQAVFNENLLREQMGLPLRTHYIVGVDESGQFVSGTGPELLIDGKPICPYWYQ